VAPGSWCPTDRSPRYDARPLRAWSGIVARIPRLRGSGRLVEGALERGAVVQASAQGVHRGLEGIDHRLVAHGRRSEVPHRRERGCEHLDQLWTVESGLVAENTSAGAKSRAPQRAACAADCGHERAPGEDEQLAGRLLRVPVKGLDDGLEPPDHVGAVISVTNGRVELDQVVPFGANGDVDCAHPGGDRGRVHDPCGDQG